MKGYFFKFISLFFLSTAVVSCGGTDEPTNDGLLMLKPNTNEIKANGIDKVTFAVTKDAATVTLKSEIWQIAGADGVDTRLEGNSFSTKQTGSYTFEARYTVDAETFTSERVTIKAVEPISEVFFRRLLTMQFTSTDCPSCPGLSTVLNRLEASETWGGRMVRTSFHMNYGGNIDPMNIELTQQYAVFLGFSGLPSCIFDLIPETREISDESKIVAHMERLQSGYPAACGVAIEATYDEASRTVNMTAKVKASETNEYRVLVFLVEDHIIAAQNGSFPYEHNNVVRKDFSAALMGDKLGSITAGSEQTKTYTATLQGDWKAENMRVVVCALNKVGDTFYGNNSTECPINGSIDYKYNEK